MIERTFEGGRLHSSLVAVKFYDDEEIVTKYGSIERAMHWRNEDISYEHKSEFGASSLHRINCLYT